MSKFRLRVWRRFRVCPGVTLNLSKGGLSTSLGVRGAHVTLGRSGVRETVGLPGSGLYLTRQTPYSARPTQQGAPNSYHAPLGAYLPPRRQSSHPIGRLMVIAFVAIWVLAMIVNGR